MRQIAFFLLIVICVNGGYGMPAEKNRYCNACTNLVDFTRNLTKQYETNGKLLFPSLIKWCIESGIGDRKMCFYMLKSLEPKVKQITSDDFCVKIDACGDKSLEKIVDEKKISNSSDINCDFCLNTFTHLKDILASQQTENEIKFVLSKSCDHLGNFKNECLKMWDQNLDDIFDFLRNAIDPKKICDALGDCKEENKLLTNNEILDKERLPAIEEVVNIGPVQPVVKVESGPECIICKKILVYVYNYLENNRTEEAIENALKIVCSDLFTGPRKDKCDQIVLKYSKDLLRVIKLATEPEIACSLLGLCVDLHIQEKPNCIICKDVIKYIYSRIKDDKTEEKILEELDKVCDRYLPVTERAKCEAMVNQYTKQIIALILSEESPESACQILGFCNNKEYLPSTAIEPATRVGLIPLTKLGFATPVGAVGVLKVDSQLCDVCRQIFGSLYSMVKNKKNRDEVIGILESGCTLCSVPDKCRQFISKNVEEILDLVAKGISPDNICSLLHVCTYSEKSLPRKIKWTEIERNDAEVIDSSKIKINKIDGEQDDNREPYNPTFSTKTKDETICFTCQVVGHFIQEQLYSNETEMEINTFIEKHLCSLINKYGIPISDQKCIEFVNLYGPMIEQMIAQKYFDPSTLCFKELKFCSKIETEDDRKSTKIQFEFIKPQKTCDVCVRVVNGLDEILAKMPIERNLTIIAENICKSFPNDDIDKCKEIIKSFGFDFMQSIGRLKNAKEICGDNDLCINPGKVHLLGAHKCTFGPTYWCHTAAHAEACKATVYCKENIWKPIVN